MTHKAVFLDHTRYKFKSPSTELNDDVVEGLQRLQSYGYLLIVVSNKSGLIQREVTKDELDEVKGSLYNSCAHLGIYLDGFYSFCDEQHILRASEDLKIDLNHSWMVGCILDDVEAGNRAGCKSIMINSGSETRWASGDYRLPAYFVRDLAEASRYIVADDKMKIDHVKVEPERVYAYSSATPNQ